MTAQGSAAGTWQVSGRRVPRRLVRAAFPAAHAPFPAGPTGGPASLSRGGVGGAIWHWPSLAGLPPMFCSQCGMSWDAELGSLGRHWCHPLDLIVGQASPSFQPGTRAGSQPPLLPVPVRLCLSLPWQPRVVQLGTGGLPEGWGFSQPICRGGPGHASEPVLGKPLSSQLPSPAPCSASDPLGPRSRSPFGMMFSGPKGLGEGAERATGPDFCSPEWDRLCTGRGSGGQRYRDVCAYTWGFL